MSRFIKSKLFRDSLCFSLILTLVAGGYIYFYNYVYSTIDVELSDNKNIDYNSKDYNIKNFVLNSNGKIKKIINKVDTKVVGKQEIVLEVEKFNIVKNVSFYVDVVDKTAPVIKIKDEVINITEGDNINLLDNISSVIDDVDGALSYKELKDVNEKSKKYYTIIGEFNNNLSGNYKLEVKAVDNSFNVSNASFSINVEKPKIVFKKIYNKDAALNSKGDLIASKAESLLGKPYVAFGNDLSGFDCSGFVQYVYSQYGIGVSRSSTTQANDGVGISYDNAKPGDILIWGYSNGYITHSAIYVGNDLMIHAANSSTGVIRSSVSGWTRGSNVEVLYVRRLEI